MSKRPQAVPVSERALFARVARLLDKQQQALHRCKPDSRGADQLGRYFITDGARNYLVEAQVDLERKARELGVLKPFEQLAED